MSTLTIKTERSSKILPGDKRGLPFEIWQIILSDLSAKDLCRISCVCKTWNYFLKSVDCTRWKELYNSHTEWKHPEWPLNVHSEPLSWKLAYRNQFVASKFWQNGLRNSQSFSCLSVLKRNKLKKNIHVGPGKEHESLRSALSVANDYDRICVHPGIYDEQFEMSSKIPFELVGCGEHGSVILVVCIEQVATTGRLSNLVLRAPWFTSFIFKIRCGFIQIDNCIFEDGMIYAQNPGSCHIRFCSFRHSAVILQHLNASIIEHCEFSQSDTADIVVEGHVKEEKNWAYPYLRQLTHHILLPHSNTNDSTNEIDFESKSTNEQPCSVSEKDEGVSKSEDAFPLPTVQDVTQKMSSVSDWINKAPPIPDDPSESKVSIIEEDSPSELSHLSEELDDLISGSVTPPESRQSHHSVSSSSSSHDQSMNIIRSDSEDDLSDGSVIMLPHICHRRPARDSNPKKRPINKSVSADKSYSKPIGFRVTNGSTTDILDKVKGCNPNQKKQPMNESVSADTCYSKPIGFSVTNDSTTAEMLNNVKGCLVHACRMTHSKGGVMVSLQGAAIISQCDISDVSYGIRCIQNALVVIVKNKIHHCRTSGIFMRLASNGLITGNDIHSNMEAGIDIRKNADPIIQHNRIHNGKRSGIVVLGSGRGIIQRNDIFENKEAGVYILYGGNPTVAGNYIYDGHAAGIAVNEGGKGIIMENTIEGNKWGGIDVRNDGSPLIMENRIMNGVGDGIVIGERAVGRIEKNIISGNMGCGVWMMNANNSCIHGNQIYGNVDSGIMMVDKSSVPEEQSPWSVYNTKRQEEEDSSVQEGGDGPVKCSQQTIIEYNSVFHNQGKGMQIQHCRNVVIQFNSIHGNQADGLLVDQEPSVQVLSNMVASNQGSGIVVSNSGQCEIIGNGVYKNRNGGIVCCNQGNVYQNDVVGNDTNGIILNGNLSVNVCENRVQSNLSPAIKIDQVKNAVIENNLIHPDTDMGKEFHLPEYDSLNEWMTSHDSWQETNGNCVFLDKPRMRPHISACANKTRIPSHCVTTIGHVTLPSADGARQSSTICTIL